MRAVVLVALFLVASAFLVVPIVAPVGPQSNKNFNDQFLKKIGEEVRLKIIFLHFLDGKHGDGGCGRKGTK